MFCRCSMHRRATAVLLHGSWAPLGWGQGCNRHAGMPWSDMLACPVVLQAPGRSWRWIPGGLAPCACQHGPAAAAAAAVAAAAIKQQRHPRPARQPSSAHRAQRCTFRTSAATAAWAPQMLSVCLAAHASPASWTAPPPAAFPSSKLTPLRWAWAGRSIAFLHACALARFAMQGPAGQTRGRGLLHWPLPMCPFPPALHVPRPSQVSHHKLCRIRVTVTNETGSVPQEGNKVMLAAVMVTHKA